MGNGLNKYKKTVYNCLPILAKQPHTYLNFYTCHTQLTFLKISLGNKFAPQSCSRMIFLTITSEAVEYVLCPQRGPNFLPMEDQVRDADLFDQETSVASLGSLLAKDWVLLKEVGPWGVSPKGFHIKYSRIHVINLSYKFEHKKTHKTYQDTLEHTSMFQGLTFKSLRRSWTFGPPNHFKSSMHTVKHLINLF